MRGLGTLGQRKGRQCFGFEVYLARAVLAHKRLGLNLRERGVIEKNGRGSRKGIVGEPNRQPWWVPRCGAKCPGL